MLAESIPGAPRAGRVARTVGGMHADAVSGQVMRPAATEAFLRALPHSWADPGRLYHAGRQARSLLEAARAVIADAVERPSSTVSFLPSPAAALGVALAGCLGGRPPRQWGPRTVIASAVEQALILEMLDEWQHAEPNRSLRLLPVNDRGAVELPVLRSALAESTDPPLVVLQQANHEVGTCQPLSGAAADVAERGGTLVVDATMTRGLLRPQGDVLILGAAGWGGGPAGVVIVDPRVRWRAPLTPDGHEHGRFPGPPFIPLAVAAAAALADCQAHCAQEVRHLRDLATALRRQLAEIPDSVLLGDAADSVPGLVAASFLYVEAGALLNALDRAGEAVVSGSSCVVDAVGPSHVLAAMGALSQGNVRITLPASATAAEVTTLGAGIAAAVRTVRHDLGAPHGS